MTLALERLTRTERDQAAPATSPLTGLLWILVCPAIAGLACGLVLVLNWGGSDVAAATHRVLEYKAHGFAVWDASWYGGQWTLNYSVAMPALGAWLGLHTCLLLASVVSALAFERITSFWHSPGARPAAVAFALLTIAPATIGQYPYLCGLALVLVSLWMAALARAGHPPAVRGSATAVAFVSITGGGLLSPLAGAFGCLALLTWWLAGSGLASRARHRWWKGELPSADRLPTWEAALLIAGVVIPVIITSVLLPGEGNMPFDFTDCLWDTVIALVLLWLSVGRGRVLQLGLALYAAALVGSYLIASPVGGNAGRLGDSFAVPIAVALLWRRNFELPALTRRLPRGGAQRLPRGGSPLPPGSGTLRQSSRRVAVLSALVAVVVVVPLVMSSVDPAIPGMRSLATRADTHRFYRPLNRYLSAHDPAGIDGRVEVVPTADHWESVWVARAEPLARGWERQTDYSDNPIFYPPGDTQAIPAHQLYDWLVDNGVAYVALPSATLDYAGVAEARTLRAGVPGLRLVWHQRGFTVWRVLRSSGIVDGDGRLISYRNERVVFSAARPGTYLIRVSWAHNWRVASGDACVLGGQRWTDVKVERPGTVAIQVAVHAGTCPASGT